MVTRGTKPSSSTSNRRTPARTTSRAAKQPPLPKRRAREDVFEYLVRLGGRIPANELEKLPRDLAANFHHYHHGAPKQDP